MTYGLPECYLIEHRNKLLSKQNGLIRAMYYILLQIEKAVPKNSFSLFVHVS